MRRMGPRGTNCGVSQQIRVYLFIANGCGLRMYLGGPRGIHIQIRSCILCRYNTHNLFVLGKIYIVQQLLCQYHVQRRPQCSHCCGTALQCVPSALKLLEEKIALAQASNRGQPSH